MKIILRLGIIALLAVLLTACSSKNPSTENPTVPPASEQTSENTVPTVEKKSPSFEDGELYLQAIAARDTKLCAKIVESDLKKRCETDAKPVK